MNLALRLHMINWHAYTPDDWAMVACLVIIVVVLVGVSWRDVHWDPPKPPKPPSYRPRICNVYGNELEAPGACPWCRSAA